MRLRNSVLDVQKVSYNDPAHMSDPTYTRVQTTNIIWRSILAGRVHLSTALADGTVTVVHNGDANLEDFMTRFDLSDQL